jgi:hypothetical protein
VLRSEAREKIEVGPGSSGAAPARAGADRFRSKQTLPKDSTRRHGCVNAKIV